MSTRCLDVDDDVEDGNDTGQCCQSLSRVPGGYKCPGRSWSVFVHKVVLVFFAAACRRRPRVSEGIVVDEAL